MKNKKLSDLSAFASILCGAIWLGAYLTRLILTYNLFEEGELIPKYFINSINLSGIFLVIEPLYYITSISYILLVICFTLFLISTRLRFKENGWLFIISIIIYFTFPFEIILLTIDYKIIALYFAESLNTELILTLIVERLQLLGGFSVILILCYFSIIYFLVFRPFTAKGQ